MTTAKTETLTVAVLAALERQLAARPGDEEYERHLDALRQKRETLSLRIQTIRSATSLLASVEPRIAAEIEWRNHLLDWRKTLCDELLAFPPRIRDDRELGSQQSVKLSIITIDRGHVSEDTGSCLETLRLGHLMRAAGYVEGPKIENQVCGRLPWFGAMPEVERRIQELQQQRDGAQARLDEAVLDDAEQGRLAAAGNVRREGFNAAP